MIDYKINVDIFYTSKCKFILTASYYIICGTTVSMDLI